MDKYFESVPIGSVVSDNRLGGYLATEYLIEHGHQSIAYLSEHPPHSCTSVLQRFFGYSQALNAHSLPIKQDRIVFACGAQAADKEDEQRILRGIIMQLCEGGVTAIHTDSDLLAIDVLTACQALSVKVPEDLALVGFDDSELAKHYGLTTVRQDFAQIGRRATELVLELTEGGEPRQEVVSVSLVERTTVR